MLSSRVHPDDSLVVRNPVAWPNHPVLTLTREEDGDDVVAVLLDMPGAVKFRVYYAVGEDVLRYASDPNVIGYLNATYLFIDYRTLLHLLNDGWRVD